MSVSSPQAYISSGPDYYVLPLPTAEQESLLPTVLSERAAVISELLPPEARVQLRITLRQVPAVRERLQVAVAGQVNAIWAHASQELQSEIREYRHKVSSGAHGSQVSGGEGVVANAQTHQKAAADRVARTHKIPRWIDTTPKAGDPIVSLFLGMLISGPEGTRRPNPLYHEVQVAVQTFFAQRFSPQNRRELVQNGEQRYKQAVAPAKTSLEPSMLAASVADAYLIAGLASALDKLETVVRKPVRSLAGRVATQSACAVRIRASEPPDMYASAYDKRRAIGKAITELRHILRRNNGEVSGELRDDIEALLVQEGYVPKLPRQERLQLVDAIAQDILDKLNPTAVMDDAVEYVETMLQLPRSFCHPAHPTEQDPIQAAILTEIGELQVQGKSKKEILRLLNKKYHTDVPRGDALANKKVAIANSILNSKPTTDSTSYTL